MLGTKKIRHTAMLIALVVCLLLTLANILASVGACAWYGYQTGRDTRYATFVGCMVKTPGGYVPRNELRTDSQ